MSLPPISKSSLTPPCAGIVISFLSLGFLLLLKPFSWFFEYRIEGSIPVELGHKPFSLNSARSISRSKRRRLTSPSAINYWLCEKTEDLLRVLSRLRELTITIIKGGDTDFLSHAFSTNSLRLILTCSFFPACSAFFPFLKPKTQSIPFFPDWPVLWTLTCTLGLRPLILPSRHGLVYAVTDGCLCPFHVLVLWRA